MRPNSSTRQGLPISEGEVHKNTSLRFFYTVSCGAEFITSTVFYQNMRNKDIKKTSSVGCWCTITSSGAGGTFEDEMILATVWAQICSTGTTQVTSPVMFKTGTDDSRVVPSATSNRTVSRGSVRHCGCLRGHIGKTPCHHQGTSRQPRGMDDTHLSSIIDHGILRCSASCVVL